MGIYEPGKEKSNYESSEQIKYDVQIYIYLRIVTTNYKKSINKSILAPPYIASEAKVRCRQNKETKRRRRKKRKKKNHL